MDIAYSSSILSKNWQNADISWEDFVARLSTPVVTDETSEQFFAMDKDKQLKIKDVGGFVGGYLSSGRRSKGNVISRSLIALDADYADADFIDMYDLLLGFRAVIHSTHKSRPDSLRLRLLIPLSRGVNSIEYEAIARKIAAAVGMQYFDMTTFQPGRLMFWPSVPSDIDYIFEEIKGEELDPDIILAQYNDWHDMREWPGSKAPHSLADMCGQVENPTEKEGLVGLFCRTYSIYEAIETFLPDVYKPEDENRYTFLQGTTKAGVVIYEGMFSFSYHGTDPATGRLCNAYDLVRIHKFGHLDLIGPGEKASNKAMQEFVMDDLKVKQQMTKEAFDNAKNDFGANCFLDLEETDDNSDEEWLSTLQMDKSGKFVASANNVNLIVKNDKNIRGAFALNTFHEMPYVLRSVPWREIEKPTQFIDADYSGIRNYIECVYGIVAPSKIDDAIQLELLHNQFHPIRDYIKSLTWDGTKRIEYLLQDYFGAEDTPYTSAVMRLVLSAAVTRVFEPGRKFDYVMVLVGAQATYKSTFIARLGKEWFSDTFMTVQGKESFEQLQGAWILEIAELAGLKRSEVENVKHYISKCADSFRPAYGRTRMTYKRQCIFIGTTNSDAFLHDTTGNRRFLPIHVKAEEALKNVAEDLTPDEIDQIWAEAYQLYLADEPLYLNQELTVRATEQQQAYVEIDERQGLVRDYLDMPVPDNWENLNLSTRLDYINGMEHTGKQRDYISNIEIWCECFGKKREDFTSRDSKDIKRIVETIPGWSRNLDNMKKLPLYGNQRLYERKTIKEQREVPRKKTPGKRRGWKGEVP